MIWVGVLRDTHATLLHSEWLVPMNTWVLFVPPWSILSLSLLLLFLSRTTTNRRANSKPRQFITRERVEVLYRLHEGRVAWLWRQGKSAGDLPRERQASNSINLNPGLHCFFNGGNCEDGLGIILVMERFWLPVASLAPQIVYHWLTFCLFFLGELSVEISRGGF